MDLLWVEVEVVFGVLPLGENQVLGNFLEDAVVVFELPSDHAIIEVLCFLQVTEVEVGKRQLFTSCNLLPVVLLLPRELHLLLKELDGFIEVTKQAVADSYLLKHEDLFLPAFFLITEPIKLLVRLDSSSEVLKV